MYVIKRDADGKMVSIPGSRYTYTDNLRRAKVYISKKSAENDCCGNEYVVNVDTLLTIFS